MQPTTVLSSPAGERRTSAGRAGSSKLAPSRSKAGAATSPGLTVITQIATARAGLPHARSFQQWARAAYGAVQPRVRGHVSVLTIRLVGRAESRRLNRTWRGKDKPTNVLSFPCGDTGVLPQALQVPQLGDLAICAAVVTREAREQRKLLRAHWAHMVIHGVLHLLGHDHENDHDAHEMEALEVQLLAGFGYSNPYA
jgi:probable rRNA maturation factor